jgi:hypothetical protein
MERAAEGNAAGGGLNAVRSALEGKPPDKDALEAERTALRRLVPGVDIWYVVQFGGVVRWTAHLEADTGDHLLEYLRDAGRDAEAGL